MTTTEGDALALFPAPTATPSAAPSTSRVTTSATGAAEAGTAQWRIESLQLVNWGGYEGAHTVRFHPQSTLMTGGSGSGKSTLLDAYLALMMRHDTPFNGASNDAAGGRARSEEQRNLLSYLRGQTDTTSDSFGEEKAQLLRGQDGPTWGAVAAVYASDAGEHFTVARVYFVPATATRAGDLVPRFLTFDGLLDVADLARFADQRFAPKALKEAFAGLGTPNNYTEFATRIFTRLGIGDKADGAMALRLLARIQAGGNFRTPDELYREMVLEVPATFSAADRALEHFDDLEDAYRAMVTAQEKAQLLDPITGYWKAYEDSGRKIRQIDTFGLTVMGPSPLTLWAARRERTVLDSAVDANRERRALASAALRVAEQKLLAVRAELEATKEEHRASGGEELEQLTSRIATAESVVRERADRFNRLAARARVLELDLRQASVFAQAQSDAAVFLADRDARSAALRRERDDVGRRSYPLEQRKRALLDDRASLQGREGRVPEMLHRLRVQAAQAAGLSLDQLSFLAELIDVAPDQRRWRHAIETVLSSSARTLLVPQQHFAAFSRAIDGEQLSSRLHFQSVPLGLDGVADPDPDKVAGKLLFKNDSPFIGWVRRHVSEPSRNAACVETAEQLDGRTFQVTLAGQTRQGGRGAHGQGYSSKVIGFSNTEALAEIDAELDEVEMALRALDAERNAIGERERRLGDLRSAHEALMDETFDHIDIDSAEARLAELQASHRRIMESDDRLSALQARITELDETVTQAQQDCWRAQELDKGLNTEWDELCGRQDEVGDEIDQLEREGGDELVAHADAHATTLDGYYADAAGDDADDLSRFGQNLQKMRQTLSKAVADAERTRKQAVVDLERTFALYQTRFPDPNRGTGISSYEEYAEILAEIVSTGLAQRREAWRDRLMKWSGEDLVPLSGAMDSAVRDIRDRLEPINRILGSLPFGATRDRLRIVLNGTRPEAVHQFLRDLRELASGATQDLDEAGLHRRFEQLRSFMGRLRTPGDARFDPKVSDRVALLDVRLHVRVTAERYDEFDGSTLAVYSSLGGKSGGESQELIAFIIGAALRFRLGDEQRDRPRFAPVLIDEGFIKSDSEFAGRAVAAWKGLGFQLIVGAPPDKVSALEPHMDHLLMVTKNTKLHYSFVTEVTDAQTFREQAAMLALEGKLGVRVAR